MGLRTSYCLQVPAGSPLSEALRGAGAEAKAKRYETAVVLQRQALDLAAEAKLNPAEVVVIELTLASYELHLAIENPDLAPAAVRTLKSVIAGTRRLEMDYERIQAEMGLATALSLQGQHDGAAQAYLNAASVSKQLGETLMAGEFIRCSADALFEDGQRVQAVARWRVALEYLEAEPEVPTVEEDLGTADEIQVVTRLREVCQSLGLHRVVRRYEDVLSRLVLLPGTN